MPVSPTVEAAVQAGIRGSGEPLSGTVRDTFEPRIGRDLSDVRVHSDPKADVAAQSINAVAFTVGSDIAFAAGAYDPASVEGKRLLAHELTHIVQQGGTAAGRAISRRKSADHDPGQGNSTPVLSEAESTFVDSAGSPQERETFLSLVAYARREGISPDLLVDLSDIILQALGVVSDIVKIQRVANWTNVMNNLGYSPRAIRHTWSAFFTNPPWQENLFLLRIDRLDWFYSFADTLGNVANVISAGLVGWNVGTHLRNLEISQAFAEAYRGFMSIAVPIGGLIDALLNLIYFVFGDVPYAGKVAEVLKALNPIELGGVAVDTLVSVVHAVGSAFGWGSQTSLEVLLRLEGRIEDAAGPIVRFFEVTGIQAVVAAGFDTVFTLLDMVIRWDFSTAEIESLIDRYESYGLGRLVRMGEGIGDVVARGTSRVGKFLFGGDSWIPGR